MVLTLALDRYDRHMPFFDGTVSVTDPLRLTVLQVGQSGTLRDGTDRHERMLQDGAYDAAELSLSSYVMAKARGMPFTATPIFPRRLFSQSQIFVNASSGIESPKDLEGKRVGLQSFQTTLAVRAKGDLALEYGVALPKINWCLAHRETIAHSAAEDYSIEQLPDGANVSALLESGEIDALFYSRLPKAAPGKIRRLFSDSIAEEARYFKKYGFWPIMHVVALRDDVVERFPDAPRLLLDAFAAAKTVWSGYLNDPNWSRVAWQSQAVERQNELIGDDPWTSGLAANRADLETFIGYSRDQGLIETGLAVESLFHESVLDS